MNKSEKFKGQYRIKSSRLAGYDYSSAGAYFVTICAKNHQHFFGEVQKGEMCLSEIGKIADNYWKEIAKHFSNAILDEYIVMPNHMHGIIFIQSDDCGKNPICRDAINRVSTGGGITGNKNPMFYQSIFRMIRWYNGRCSFEIHSFSDSFAWQARFNDHIIRDDDELNRIREYIIYNPQNGDKDEENIFFQKL